jgi:hypothetical protein
LLSSEVDGERTLWGDCAGAADPGRDGSEAADTGADAGPATAGPAAEAEATTGDDADPVACGCFNFFISPNMVLM